MTTPINEPIYKKVEIVGTSDVSIEAAVNNAVAISSQSLRNIRWFEIDEIRGSIEDGQVNQWQVGVKLAFTVDHQNPFPNQPDIIQDKDTSLHPQSPNTDGSSKEVI